MITKPSVKLSRRSLVGKQTHNLEDGGERELAAAINLATWEERMSALARLREAGQFPPDKLGDRIDPYNEMIRAHRGRIAHTFDSHCKCACGVQEHDEEECRMRAGNYVWICRRCGVSWREY